MSLQTPVAAARRRWTPPPIRAEKAGSGIESSPSPIIGLLIVSTAIAYRPDKAVGLDAALTSLATQTYGTALLLLVAAGLACFGVYCLFDARYRRGRPRAAPTMSDARRWAGVR